MSRLTKSFALALVLLTAPTALAGSSSTVPGSWRKLPMAPVAIPQGPWSVWTGLEMIVFGRTPQTNPSVDVAEAYVPASHTWTQLTPPKGPDFTYGFAVVWTGKEMLAFGSAHSVAYSPSTGTWRELPKRLPTPGGLFPGGIAVWTGREAIGWGGGCCGDAWSNGVAYNPVANRYRNLPKSPLAASQGPVGAWTGRELDLFVGGFDPMDKAYPARLARAAAYSPKTNTWRRIAPLPGSDVRYSHLGSAVWDGREILVVGAGTKGRSAFAYNPRTNVWRTLAPLPASRAGATAVWTGTLLFVWGGSNPRGTAQLPDGVAYNSKTDRWSTIPSAPLRARYAPAVQWTGHELIVWGGGIPRKVGAPRFVRDGAAFTPTAP